MRQLTSRQRRAALALGLVAVLFIAFDVVGASFQSARAGTRGYFGALYRGTDSVVGPARRFVQNLPHTSSNVDTITALRRQVADLQRAQTAQQQNAATAARLAALQLQATRGGYRVLPARVTAIGPDGLRVDQTVIAGDALVGRITQVWPSSATVLLAADPRSGVGARDSRTGQLGVVTGHGSAGFTYLGLDPNAGPAGGDVLLTGPTSATTYVPGLRIGTVRSVVTQANGSRSAVVTPAVTATTLDLVGVILVGGRPLPRTPLTPATTPPGTTTTGAVPNAAPAPAPSTSPSTGSGR